MMHCQGAALIALGIYLLFFRGRTRIRATFLHGPVAGGFAGFLSGLFAVGGPSMAVYLLEATKSNDEYRDTLNTHFCITPAATAYTRRTHGAFSAPAVHAYLLVLAALVIGTWAGNKVFHTFDKKKLTAAVYSCLIFSGVLMLFK